MDFMVVNEYKEILAFNYDLLGNTNIHIKQVKKLDNINDIFDKDKKTYNVKFDSLNPYLQRNFTSFLQEADIEEMSKIAKYVSINREHAKYLNFLEESFKLVLL